LAQGADPKWRPDILHAHDWHAGLAPAYLRAAGAPVPSVFTVHNLAYQGFFPAAGFADLALPPGFFSIDGVEFYGGISLLKAGLFYADRLTTVSPTYVREIQTAAFGNGLDGLLRSRAGVLSGILNGVDPKIWSPENDALLPRRYGPDDAAAGKAAAKAALQRRLGLATQPEALLFGAVTRLSSQKGLDLLLAALPALLAEGAQLAMLGSGDSDLEAGFAAAAAAHPGQAGIVLGYDEALSHLIMAAADVILVPSRFEPCGLTQLCALRYGSVPVVARVGGLADTVIDANEAALEDGVATGFQFAPVEAWALADAIRRAVQVYHCPEAWGQLVERAMTRDVGWRRAARRYLELYRGLLSARGMGPG
jgi:starch synthase